MDRREFLRRIRHPAVALAAAPVAAAAADRSREAGAAARAALKARFDDVFGQCEAIRARLDRLEARQKRMMRVVLAAAAVTVGVDLSLLL